MTQTDLFDRLTGQAPQNWRNSDPATSRAAGLAAKKFKGQQSKQVYDTLAASSVPLAAEQIADKLGMVTLHPVARRASELIDAGYIEPVEELHTNRSGAKARKYRVRS